MSRIVCDENLCSGCLACIVACLDQHYEETQTNVIAPRIAEPCIRPSGLKSYLTRSCLHCQDAPCIKVCSMKVLERTEQGFVVAKHLNRCIGCKKCAKVCPHDVPRFDMEGKLVKCDGCATRVACGLEPACVRACNTGALKLIEE